VRRAEGGGARAPEARRVENLRRLLEHLQLGERLGRARRHALQLGDPRHLRLRLGARAIERLLRRLQLRRRRVELPSAPLQLLRAHAPPLPLLGRAQRVEADARPEADPLLQERLRHRAQLRDRRGLVLLLLHLTG